MSLLLHRPSQKKPNGLSRIGVAGVPVGPPSPGGIAPLYGINISPSFQRMYNNILAREPWLGDPAEPNSYGNMPHPYVNAAGDFVTLPPGITTARMGIPSPGAGTSGWYRLTFSGAGDGSTVFFERNPSTIPGSVTRVDGHTFEYQMVVPADYTDPNSGCYLATNSTPTTPISNIDCREITGSGGTIINAGVWHPAFIQRLKDNGDNFRTLDVQGINSPHMPTRKQDSWADRAMSRRALTYQSAHLILGTGTSRLLLEVKKYLETDAQAELLATRMATNTMWTGSGGNNLNLTILAPSGAGSVYINSDYNITVIPAVGASNAAAIKAQLDAHPVVSLMLDVTAGGSGAVGTLSQTFFSGGFDGAMGGYWPDIIELCNQVGKTGPWVHLPYNANTDYATGLATLLNSTLNTNLRTHFNLQGSNEDHWNYATQATRWTYANAVYNGRTGGGLEKMAHEFTARFLSTFAAIKAVAPWVNTGISSQTSNATFSTWIKDTAGFSSSIINEIYLAPYFLPDGTLVDDDTYFAGAYISARDIADQVLAHRTILNPLGIPVKKMYESGPHDHLESDMTTAERRRDDPRLGQVCNFYMSELRRRLGDDFLLMWFNDYAPTGLGPSGQWGLWRYVGEPDTPKSIAWFDARAGRWQPYFLPDTSPTITGTRVTGQTLTLNVPPYYRATGIEIAWTRDGVVISGETGTTYEQVDTDIGTVITATVHIYNATYDYDYVVPDGAATEDEVPPFSLGDLTTLLARWDATTGMTLSGAYITSWAAAQGSGTLSTAGNAPSRVTVDGKLAAEFDSAEYQDFLNSNISVGTGAWTMMFVGRLYNADITGDRSLCGSVNGGPSVDTQLSGTRIRVVRQNVAVVGQVSSGFDLTNRFVLTVRFNGTNHLSIRVNGVEVGTVSAAASFVNGNLVLGTNPANANAWRGSIHCFAACNDALSEGLVAAWENYEAAQWGITIA